MKIDVILLSAGYGKRYREGQITYKPLLKIKNKEICKYTIEFFDRNPYINKIILVVPKEQINVYQNIIKGVKKEVVIIGGGDIRWKSVYNGLKKVTSDKVIIHDIVRPFINNQMIKDLINGLANFDSVSTAIPSISTMAYTNGKVISEIPIRENLYELQTPQAFDTKKLIEIHEELVKSEDKEKIHQDPSRLMHGFNYQTLLVKGSPENIKITYEKDLYLAEVLIDKINAEFKFVGIDEIKKEFQSGKPIILTDDEKRENEGDLFIPAELITPDIINFMVTKCRGMICVPLAPEEFERLGLELIKDFRLPNCSHNCVSCGYCIATPLFAKPIDSKETETGISVYDRYLTIKKILDQNSKIDDFRCPGHVFPIMARWEGVKARQGHTEGATDLCRILGYRLVGVICEIIKENGEMARLDDLKDFAKENGLKISTIEIIKNFVEKGGNV